MVDLAEASKVIESDERQMIHSVFELGNTIVREVMVPRTDIVFIEQTKTLRQAMSLALRSGFSRLPVVGENEDDVVGTVYLRDITRRVFEYRESESTERVESLMRPATFVPDSKPVDVLLREMQAERIHLVIVVDEYGGTAGLATIEDILEEIVGEITDEHDREGPRIERLADGAVRVTARLPVDELAELFDVEIEDDDGVETVGGLLAQALGRVPIPGATATVAGLELVAEGARGRRNTIASVVVRLTDEARAKSRRLREAIDGIPDADEPDTGRETEAMPMANSAAEAAGVAPASNGSGRDRRRGTGVRRIASGPMPDPIELKPDDAKLVTLARSARARNNTAEGAAVRDDTGRTYVATTVELPSLPLSALQAAVVIAVASGADALEAAAIVGAAADRSHRGSRRRCRPVAGRADHARGARRHRPSRHRLVFR